jgi:hypothetical protein
MRVPVLLLVDEGMHSAWRDALSRRADAWEIPSRRWAFHEVRVVGNEPIVAFDLHPGGSDGQAASS